jgi:hypothetical protein
MNASFWKKPALSAVAFFGTLLALSVGYAAWNSGMAKVNVSDTLRAANWNALVDNINDLSSRWPYVTGGIAYTGGNVGIGTASPGAAFEVTANASSGLPSVRIKNGASHTEFFLDSSAANRVSNLDFLNNAVLKWQISSRGTVDAVNTDRLAFFGNSSEVLSLLQNGNVGIGTTNPGATLEVNGTLKVGGSVTGNSTSDIKAYIQRVACESRRGVWVENVGCQEYAYFSATAAAYPGGGCVAGYHICTFPDLFSGGFESLRRSGYNAATPYVWIGGNYPSQQDRFFTTWSYGPDLACSAGAHYMMDLRRNAGGSTAWGCYSDSYVNVTACCQDNQ